MDKRTNRWLAAMLAITLLGLALGGAASAQGGPPAGNTVRLEAFSPSGLIEMVDVPASAFKEAPGFVAGAAPPSFEVVKLVDNGLDSQNVVLTILGDGFTAGEQDAFVAAARDLSNYLLGKHPFSSFRDKFNVYAIKVISAQSGAAEAPGATVNNYFGSKFYFNGVTDRLLYPSYDSKVFELLDYYTPLCDMPVVLVNSTMYGGGGGRLAAVSCNAAANEVLVHELGHSVGGLADEYWWSGYEAPNMTRTSNPATVKWRTWLNVEEVGIYAHEENTSWYRPHQDCMMRYLNRAFCEVCASELTRVMADVAKEDFHGRKTITSAAVAEGKTRIGDYTFYGCESLASVTIAGSVASIGRYAFLRCTKLVTIRNYAQTPQNITGNDVFYGVDRSKITLHVPEGTQAAYLAAGWTGFKEILELGAIVPLAFSPRSFTVEYRGTTRLTYTGDNAAYSWRSSNPAVEVDDAGNARSVKSFSKMPKATITVYDGSRVVDTCEVQVSPSFFQWLLIVLAFGWVWY